MRPVVLSLYLMSLAACGGGAVGEGLSPIPIENGLPYAEEGQTLLDFKDQSSDVTLVRHMLDGGSGEPFILVEVAGLEVAELQGDGPLLNLDPTMTLKIGEETLSFVDGRATDSNGKIWSAYIDTTGAVSGTAGVYHYDYGLGPDAFDTEGVFAFGFLTDPAELIGRADIVSYDGNWFGYGVVTDGAAGIIANEAIGGGDLVLVADFDSGTVGGTLTGSYDSFGRVVGVVEAMSIADNGFAGTFQSDCSAGASCASNTILGGAFFGVDGAEISGAIGFDERRVISGETRRLVSSAGYTLFPE